MKLGIILSITRDKMLVGYKQCLYGQDYILFLYIKSDYPWKPVTDDIEDAINSFQAPIEAAASPICLIPNGHCLNTHTATTCTTS